jgi:DNA primase
MSGIPPSFDGMPDEPEALWRWLPGEGRLDFLRSRIRLSELVMRKVPLETAEHGEMRAACPHPEHEDDQKAFFVNDEKGVFHCFGCGIHGDAIRWMTDHEGHGYVEAVRRLLAMGQKRELRSRHRGRHRNGVGERQGDRAHRMTSSA